MASEPKNMHNDEPVDIHLNRPGKRNKQDSPKSEQRDLSLLEVFSSQLTGELPRCPECAKIMKVRNLERCDYCGFSFSYLTKLFPVDQLPTLEPLLDFSNKLNSDEKKDILTAISFVKKRYPQLIPKVCILPLQSDVQVQQMALWMINQCPPLKGETQEDKKWYFLLLIDTAKNKSALAYGYNAEIFIPDASAASQVAQLNKSLNTKSLGLPVVTLLTDLVPILDTSKRTIKKLYKLFKKNN